MIIYGYTLKQEFQELRSGFVSIHNKTYILLNLRDNRDSEPCIVNGRSVGRRHQLSLKNQVIIN